jgi:Cu/Ag efflux protein CusF
MAFRSAASFVRMSRLSAALVLALGLVTLACNGGANTEPAHAAAPTEYTTRGNVRAIDTAARSVTIEHEDVPGYMPGMTMPFDLAAGVSLDGIAVGTRIEFRFHPATGGRHVVTSIRKL